MEKDFALKSRTVCFTGHRRLPDNRLDSIRKALDIRIEDCISSGFDTFLAGGALGFDTEAAFRVLAAKEKHPTVKLILILPCRDQTLRWTDIKDLSDYQTLKDRADGVIYIQNFYDSKCMMKRNIFMVDSSSLCISYYTGKSGGTAATVRYANEKGVKTVNLAEIIE